jgi:FkbM family methyltransferase
MGRITDALFPPSVSIRLRARAVGPGNGVAPPISIINLVPEGRLAVDVGAHRGLWSYWFSRRAGAVHSFEPNPHLYAFLARTRLRNVHPHEVALSDAEGTAELYIPAGGNAGRGSIQIGGISPLATVATRQLDSYAFENIGFIKIDVEGHEEAVLRGAALTIERWHPALVIEIEDRHNPGAIARIPATLRDIGYQYAYVERSGTLQPLEAFDLRRDQLDAAEMSADYVNNFVFTTRSIDI